MTKTDESTLQIHKHANDYRDLCNLAGDVLKERPVKLPDGYEVLYTQQGDFNFNLVLYIFASQLYCYVLGLSFLLGY